MKRQRVRRREHHGDDLLEHVRFLARGVGRARLRRPRKWSRDDFERWIKLGCVRGYWTYDFEVAGDVVVLETLAALFDERVDDATA